MCGEKIANRFGRPFRHSMESVELQDLKAGDHIVEECYYTFWHHMIVDKEEEKVDRIHYYEKTGPSGSGSTVCRGSFNENDTYYRIIYKDEECLSPEKVVEKAKEIMNKGEHSYNFVSNNCEHFANECKTGKSTCHQMWTAIEILGKSALSSILSFVIQTFRSGSRQKIDPNSAFDKVGAQFNPRLAAIFASISEMFLLYHDYAALEKYDEVVVKAITKRVCAAVGSIVGDLIGFYLGNIKRSFLGATVGGWVLPVLGTIALGCVGDWVAKLMFALLGELLAPLITELRALFRKKSQ